MVHRTEKDLVEVFKLVSKAHGDEVNIKQTCLLLSSQSKKLADDVERVAKLYSKKNDKDPDMSRWFFVNLIGL